MPGAGNRKRQRRKQHRPVPFEYGEWLGARHSPFDKGETCLRLLLPKRQIDISIGEFILEEFLIAVFEKSERNGKFTFGFILFIFTFELFYLWQFFEEILTV